MHRYDSTPVVSGNESYHPPPLTNCCHVCFSLHISAWLVTGTHKKRKRIREKDERDMTSNHVNSSWKEIPFVDLWIKV